MSAERGVRETARARALLLGVFAASGAAALVLEITWMRWLRILLGATAPAASATLVAFFAGSAAGARWGASRVGRLGSPGRALRLYAAFEAGVVICGAAVPLLLRLGEAALGALYPWVGDQPTALAPIRFAVAALAAGPAAFALGATLPALTAALLESPRRLGSGGSALYAVNTAGAAVGAALASWWLPPRIGVPATYGLGLALSGGAAAVAAWLARGAGGPGRSGSGGRRNRGDGDRRRGDWLDGPGALAAVSGFLALAAQVLWVQAFAQVLNQSVLAFGAVLVVVLVGLALGSALVAWLERTRPLHPAALAAAALGIAGLGLALFPALLFHQTDGLGFVGSGSPGWAYLGTSLRQIGASVVPALLPAALVLPAALAWAGRRTSGTGATAGGRIGRLAAQNTLGAIGGALAAPYLLTPWLGPWDAFLALVAVALLAVGVLAWRVPPARPAGLTGAALAAGGLAWAAWAGPEGAPTAPGERVLARRTSAAGVVEVVARRQERLIRVDNHYALGGSAERVHEERQGHLPLLLHAAPRRVAFVGPATGISAGAAVLHPVESIRLVEIVPDVARLAREHFADVNRGVYRDPRTRVALDDARNFFHHTRERYDAIVADLFVPWRAGTGALYTTEHFTRMREALAPRGLVCQWLPLYQLSAREVRLIAASFADVFPASALFRGDFYGRFPIAALVGWRDRPASPGEIARAVARLGAQDLEDRWVVGPGAPWTLFVGGLPAAEPGAPRQRDAWPRLEFWSAAGHAGGGTGLRQPAVGSRWIALARSFRARAGIGPWAALPEPALRAAAGGEALQQAGALYAAGRAGEASRALAVAAERLDDALLDPRRPDPSAAELWFEPGPGSAGAP